jgi:glyoxylase-like metal-dependent hydrolase (beta-lactamase superfamily II)
MWWLLTSQTWIGPMPINAYVIEHEQGLVLFDCGQDRQSVLDPDYFPKGPIGFLYDRLAKFEIGPDETLPRLLASLGHDLGEVKLVVMSHLHQDHIGGLAELKDAEIIVSQEEWGQLGKRVPELDGFLTRHIDVPGLNWKKIELAPTSDESVAPFASSYDVFDDGSLVLLPTPGHTAGSLSMLIRDPALPPMLLVGDVTYDVNLMEGERVPGVGDRQQLVESTRKINALRSRYPDLLILACHDPAAAGMLGDATAAFV